MKILTGIYVVLMLLAARAVLFGTMAQVHTAGRVIMLGTIMYLALRVLVKRPAA